MSVESAVQKIADTMADAEKGAAKAQKDFRQLRDEFKEISDGVPGTALLAAKYQAQLVAISAAYGADLLAWHYDMTEDAKALGIDIPAPPPPEGEFGILSGSR